MFDHMKLDSKFKIREELVVVVWGQNSEEVEAAKAELIRSILAVMKSYQEYKTMEMRLLADFGYQGFPGA